MTVEFDAELAAGGVRAQVDCGVHQAEHNDEGIVGPMEGLPPLLRETSAANCASLRFAGELHRSGPGAPGDEFMSAGTTVTPA